MIHEGWLIRAQELILDADPAWRERGEEILRGEL